MSLTIDDSPHPSITPKILDLLKQHQCKATFFCIGDYIKNVRPELMHRMRADGHELGNHLMKDEPAYVASMALSSLWP